MKKINARTIRISIVFGFLFIFVPIAYVKADTFFVCPNTSCPDLFTSDAAVTVNLNNINFSPGDTIRVSGSIQNRTCNNQYVSMKLYAGLSSVSANMQNGSSLTYPNSIVDVLDNNNNTFYGSTTFTAPTTPGNYYIIFRAYIGTSGVSGAHYNFNVPGYYSIPFTVVAPPPPPPDQDPATITLQVHDMRYGFSQISSSADPSKIATARVRQGKTFDLIARKDPKSKITVCTPSTIPANAIPNWDSNKQFNGSELITLFSPIPTQITQTVPVVSYLLSCINPSHPNANTTIKIQAVDPSIKED